MDSYKKKLIKRAERDLYTREKKKRILKRNYDKENTTA